MESQDLYREGEIDLSYGYVYISFAMNLSITWAAWVLVLFYLAFKPELAPHQPAYKFLCIKAVLFLSFWQSVALAIAAQLSWIHEIGSYTSTDVKTGINNLLLCIEMLFISYLHKRAFPYRQYKMTQGNISNGSLLDNLAVMDTVRDFNDAKPLGERIVLPTGFKPEVRSSKKAFPMVGVSDDDANLRIGSSRIEDDYVPLDITEQSVQPEALDAETELGWRETNNLSKNKKKNKNKKQKHQIMSLCLRCLVRSGLVRDGPCNFFLFVLYATVLFPFGIYQLIRARLRLGSFARILWCAARIGKPQQNSLLAEISVEKAHSSGFTRIVGISDTHNLHGKLRNLPVGDILVHAGDFSQWGTLSEVRMFAEWFGNQPFKHKILVPGNHDVILDRAFMRATGETFAAQRRPPMRPFRFSRTMVSLSSWTLQLRWKGSHFTAFLGCSTMPRGAWPSIRRKRKWQSMPHAYRSAMCSCATSLQKGS